MNMYFIWMVLEVRCFFKASLNHLRVQQIDRYHFDRQSFGKRCFCCKSCAFLAESMLCSLVLERAVSYTKLSSGFAAKGSWGPPKCGKTS